MGKISLTMDMWSDPNLMPFMAVTAHWIKGKTEETVNGPKLVLNLRADLIGFQRVPGRHDGEHLAHAFLFVTDRLKITEKVMSASFSLRGTDTIIFIRLGGSRLITLQIMILLCQAWSTYFAVETSNLTELNGA
jgi:hypothetical protein